MTSRRKHEPIARTRGDMKVTHPDGTVQYVKANASQARRTADQATKRAGRSSTDSG